MTDPTSSSSSSGPQLPKKVDLSDIPIKPGDEKLLNTGFGKMFASMPGAQNQDKDTLIREVKASMNMYVQSITREIQREQKEAQKTAQMMKRVAEGQAPE